VIASKDSISENYIAGFESAIALYKAQHPYLASLKEQARERFAVLGFPTSRHEEWKYTRVKPVVSQNYKTTGLDYAFNLSERDIQPFLLPASSALLVIENGVFNARLSSVEIQKEGIVIGSLSENLSHPLVQKHLARYAPFAEEAFVALNTAGFRDGVFISIPDNTTLEKPVQILCISDSRREQYVSYPRALIVAGRSSHVQVVESYHSMSGESSFTNAVIEVVAGENADVDLYKVQSGKDSAAQVNYTQVHQEKSSNCSVHTITLSGGFVRNNLSYRLEGINCEAHMYGLYLLAGNQVVDNHTFVDHASPNCYSNELYKGIMADRSTGVFNGKIMVRQDAQKTNAYQSNSNILLSDDAAIYTKPQLEIFADDVKCSHGATTGQLDSEALFYLRARGIGEEQARAMLMFAFAGDVLNTVRIEPLRESLLSEMAKRFQQEL
jgi:Fe-S cluster assembly protein SufD